MEPKAPEPKWFVVWRMISANGRDRTRVTALFSADTAQKWVEDPRTLAMYSDRLRAEGMAAQFRAKFKQEKERVCY